MRARETGIINGSKFAMDRPDSDEPANNGSRTTRFRGDGRLGNIPDTRRRMDSLSPYQRNEETLADTQDPGKTYKGRREGGVANTDDAINNQ